MAIAEVRKCSPSNIADLKAIVEGLVESIDPDEVERSVQHIHRRSHACLISEGARFEHKLEKSAPRDGGCDC